MASLTITNTFVASTKIIAAQVNTNYTDISGYINDRNAGTTDWDFVSSAGLITAKALINANNGLVSTPSYAFTADPDTGMWLNGDGNLNFATAGSDRLRLNATAMTSLVPIRETDGSAGTPSYTFTSDLNTGMYWPQADQVALTTGGAQRLLLTNSVAVFDGNVSHPDGTEALPSVTFSNDIDTGWYSSSADGLSATVGGSRFMTMNASVLTLLARARSTDGTTALPAYSFDSDPDTGMYRVTTDVVGIACNGLQTFQTSNNSANFAQNGVNKGSIDNTATAGHTALRIWDVDNGTLERVTVGIANSGGSGFKVLRIPN